MPNIIPLLPPVPAGEKPRVAIFLSGSGSNAEKILERHASEKGGAPFDIVALVTDAPKTSRANELGERFGIPVVAEDIRDFYHARGETRVSIATPAGQAVRKEWTDALRAKLAPLKVTFALFAGFVPLTNLTQDYPCLNVHPGDLTYLKDGQRHLVGLHEIPVERAILDGLDYLRSSVILAGSYSGRGDDMDNGAILGISAPMEMEVPEEELKRFQAIAAGRPARRPVGGFRDELETFASDQQSRLKEAGDWVVFPPVVWDFAADRFYIDSENGALFFRSSGKTMLPIQTVEYSSDGSRELLLGH